jgi:hypothetical protein
VHCLRDLQLQAVLVEATIFLARITYGQAAVAVPRLTRINQDQVAQVVVHPEAHLPDGKRVVRVLEE